MSSFRDSDVRTRIEEDLMWTYENYYLDRTNSQDNKDTRMAYIAAAIEALGYIVDNWVDEDA